MTLTSKGKLPIYHFAYHVSGLSAPEYGGTQYTVNIDAGIAGMVYQGDVTTLFLDHVYFVGGLVERRIFSGHQKSRVEEL